jgi:predicted phosphodiesterase
MNHTRKFSSTMLLALFVSFAISAQAKDLLERATRTLGDTDVKFEFTYNKQRGVKYLELSHAIKDFNPTSALLNGSQLPAPMEGMTYSSLTAIPASFLKSKGNVLSIPTTEMKKVHDRTQEKAAKNAAAKGTAYEKVPFTVNPDELKISLNTLRLEDAAFVSGPILGDASENAMTITCRMNFPVAVNLKINKKTMKSKPAIFHRFKVERLTAGTEYPYQLEVIDSGLSKPIKTDEYIAKTYAAKVLKFGLLGDSRSGTSRWKLIAEAMGKENPQFVLHTGDMVSHGTRDEEWTGHFCGTAKEVFAKVPFYLVGGNHDRRSPIMKKLFSSPGWALEWSQQIGNTLVVGMTSGNVEWLEEILSKSDAEYIFVCTHAPAWSSGPHGCSKGAQKILEVMEKYNATAMFAGHDHAYERSEPPGGVSVIISGGAGAPLYGKSKKNPDQNPHSKVFVKDYHYCVLTVTDQGCTVVAKDIEGKMIDTHTWKPRSKR